MATAYGPFLPIFTCKGAAEGWADCVFSQIQQSEAFSNLQCSRLNPGRRLAPLACHLCAQQHDECFLSAALQRSVYEMT